MLALASFFVLYILLFPAAATLSCWQNTTCNTDYVSTAFPGPWEASILSPASRTARPTSILVRAGPGFENNIVPGPGNESYSQVSLSDLSAPSLRLRGNGSHLILDFGIEVGGLVTLEYTVEGNGSDTAAASIGLAFSETSNHIGEFSDCSNNPKKNPDGAIYSNITGPGDQSYTMPQKSLRGGFRYLTLFLLDDASAYTISFSNITLEIGFQPTWTNLRAYQGYFHSSDAMLNRIWYSGAYTLQTNVVPPSTGRHSPSLSAGWANDGYLGPGSSILVDGAKRDRAVWPGDMGVAVPSLIVSTGDLECVKNALQVMYDYQNSDGSFPEAGPPLLQQGSDTYHMWTMIGTYNYVLYTNDTTFLAKNWNDYVRAMVFITGKQTYASGLLNVTGVRDWARYNVGANMTEAQVILYHTLVTGAVLSEWMEGPSSRYSALWSTAAENLRSAILAHCLDNAHGALRDNATATTLYPQDANSLALSFGLLGKKPTNTVADADIVQRISARLTDNWGSYGPSAPELPGEVSPFISSWEVRGHLVAGQTDRAIALMRTLWGQYLDNPTGSQSTLIEGFLDDGSYAYRYDRGYGSDSNIPAVAASYTSHSHGWSAGPTSALTEFVLGLSVTGRAGSTWSFAPQLSSLSWVEGGFATPLGLLRASWKRHGNTYTASIGSPATSTGTLVLPIARATSPSLCIIVNGRQVRSREYRLQTSHVKGVASTVTFPVKGGKLDIVVIW